MYTANENHRDFKSTPNSIANLSTVILSLPFDIARDGYTKAVKTGLIQDSLIACARYARDLSASEKMALGPWARSC